MNTLTETDTTVIVEAPARFAVIAPGVPTPTVIIASTDQISDLVGFYSIKEAGLEEVLTPKDEKQSSAVFTSLILGRDIEPERYLTFDLWAHQGAEARERLYSLIISSPGFSRQASRSLDEFSAKIGEQLGRVVKAYASGQRDELVYLGQMLSTFVSFLLSRLESEENRRKRRIAVYYKLLYSYAAVIAAATSLALGFAIVLDKNSSLSEIFR